MPLSRSAALVAAAALALAGCGGTDTWTPAQTASSAATATDDGAADAAQTALPLTLDDAWAKAVEELPDAGARPAMTGVFGTLVNTGDVDVRLTGGSSPAAGSVELHETVMSDEGMVMRETDGGLVVPAGGSLVLEPGGHHVMLMDLTEPIPAGADVELVLHAEGGAEISVRVPARTFAGAEETYAPGEESHTSAGS